MYVAWPKSELIQARRLGSLNTNGSIFGSGTPTWGLCIFADLREGTTALLPHHERASLRKA
jgi:hypothetical protein